MPAESNIAISRRHLPVGPLTVEAFRPYGEVIATASAGRHYPINQGHAERFHDLARLDTQEAGGRPLLSIFRALPRTLPLRLSLVERHLLGSQAFMPLTPQRFLVVVAPAGPPPSVDALCCFLAAPGQGVNYSRGTWHHPLLALDAGGDFLVLDRGGPEAADDCEEHVLGGADGAWIEAV